MEAELFLLPSYIFIFIDYFNDLLYVMVMLNPYIQSGILLFIVIISIYTLNKFYNKKSDITFDKVDVPTSIKILINTFFLQYLGIILINILMNLFNIITQEQIEVINDIKNIQQMSIFNKYSFVIYVAIVGPILEEILFRGLLFRKIYNYNVSKIAYVMSSFIFALAHFNWNSFFIYFWLGITSSWIYEKTGRISMAIFLHIINNTMVLIWLFYDLT